MTCRHVVSVSGGKDSAATLLLALERFGRETVVPIFCDTGNEHEACYEYLDYLEKTLGVKITRLRASFDAEIAAKRRFIASDQRTGRDAQGRRLRWSNKSKRRALAALHPTGNPFLDLCMWKGRFPSRKAQFCTQELKTNLAVEFQLSLIDAGYTVVSWQGIRRDESLNRRGAKRFEAIGGGLFIYRPIVEWTAADVFAFAADRGIRPNPLYLQDMTRVGCMPCINVAKPELLAISRRFPMHLGRIADWERIVSDCSKRGFSTFMVDSHSARDRRVIFDELNIGTRIRWAQTSRGGRQFDLLAGIQSAVECSSSYGLCE